VAKVEIVEDFTESRLVSYINGDIIFLIWKQLQYLKRNMKE